MPPPYGPEPRSYTPPLGGTNRGLPSDYPIEHTPTERILRELLPPARLPDTPWVDPYGEFPGKYAEWQTNPPKFWFDMVEADPPVSQEYKDRFRQKWWWDRGNEGPAPLWDRPF